MTGDNSRIMPGDRGVKNNGNFCCITSILNLEQLCGWSRAWLPTVNSSSTTGVALSNKKVKINDFPTCVVDQRRVKEIRMYLTKLRLTPEKVERPKKEVNVSFQHK